MNREIKFRVWDKELKCFIYDFVIDSKNGNIGACEDQNRFILQQYSGLKDRNNK